MSNGAPGIILNPGECPKDQCRDRSNGKCSSVVAECLVEPCEVTEECDADLCTPNYCSGYHAVCATETPGVVLNPGDCPEEGQCLDPSNGKCTFAVADCLVELCKVTE